jgi:excisionase family DNA binding protein
MSRVRDRRALLALPAKLLRRRRSLQAPEGAPAAPALRVPRSPSDAIWRWSKPARRSHMNVNLKTNEDLRIESFIEGRIGSQKRLVRMSGSLLTADQVARMLGVPKTWVYEQSRKKRIPTVTLGRYRRYRPETIEKWVAELEAEEARV